MPVSTVERLETFAKFGWPNFQACKFKTHNNFVASKLRHPILKHARAQAARPCLQLKKQIRGLPPSQVKMKRKFN